MKPHVVTFDDGSTLIEWVDSDKRFGLSMEKKLTESSWYFVTKNGTMEGDTLPLFILEALVGCIRG